METVNIIIEMEDGGVMKGELYPEIAPISAVSYTHLDVYKRQSLSRTNLSGI